MSFKPDVILKAVQLEREAFINYIDEMKQIISEEKDESVKAALSELLIESINNKVGILDKR